MRSTAPIFWVGCCQRVLGRCLNGTIELNPKLWNDELRQTVIHETVHVAVPGDGHGLRFQRVLRRIGHRQRLGAAGPFYLEHRLYEDLLKDEVHRLANRNPWRSWPEVCRGLARRHRLTEAEFTLFTTHLCLGH